MRDPPETRFLHVIDVERPPDPARRCSTPGRSWREPVTARGRAVGSDLDVGIHHHVQDEKSGNVFRRFERLIKRADALEAPIHTTVGKLHRDIREMFGKTLLDDALELLRKQVVGVLRLQLLDLELVLEPLHSGEQRRDSLGRLGRRRNRGDRHAYTPNITCAVQP